MATTLTLGIGGCQTATVDQPLTADSAGNDPAAQLQFWHSLSQRPVTSNDEAFHALLLYLDGQDSASGYEQRVELLTQRGVLPEGFDRPGNEAVQRGTLAVALVKAAQIKGGVMMRLIGPTERYAVRELQYVGVFPPSGTHQTFSGGEFLDVLGRIEDYQLRANFKASAQQLSAHEGSSSTGGGAHSEKR